MTTGPEDKRRYRLSEIADALDVPLARVRTLRARGHAAMGGGDGAAGAWRTYSIDDAVAIGCVLSLIDKGLAANVAAGIVAGGGTAIRIASHPTRDVWIERRIGDTVSVSVNASAHYRKLKERLDR